MSPCGLIAFVGLIDFPGVGVRAVATGHSVQRDRRRPSDLLGTPIGRGDPEYMEQCSIVVDMWLRDPDLHVEFADIVAFFDWSFEVAETLIRSATNKT